MNFKIIILLSSIIVLSSCFTNEYLGASSHNHSKIDSQIKQHLIAEKEINNIIQNEKSIRILGKASLYKINEGCLIVHSFLYSKSSVVTYHYTFNKNRLISAYSTSPDEFHPNNMNHSWNDPEDKTIIDSFNNIKQFFSADEISQCS